jgi:hypothetical protein
MTPGEQEASRGVIAAGAVLGRNPMRAIAAGEVVGDGDRLPPVRDDWDPWRTGRHGLP